MASPGKAFYTGLFRHNLDDKNRLTIPSAWRSTHGEDETFLATPNPDGYIAILPPAEVEKLHNKISAFPIGDRDAQDWAARFFSETQSFSFDKQGRVALTDHLRLHASIDKETVLVGSGNKFNLYSPAAWARVNQRTSGDNYGDIMRRLGI
jgi:MraZ protein